MELRLFVFSLVLCTFLLFAFDSEKTQGTRLLVLMYHHVDSVGDGKVTVSAQTFESQLELLRANGYSFVSFDDVIAYVDGEGNLPQKPVCIVFDDGYESNYSLAYPILRRFMAKATFCVIGSAVGTSYYKGTDFPVIPHFSWEQAKEMTASGLVTVGSHTYDMHMYPPYEKGLVREFAVPLYDESDADFEVAFRRDCGEMTAVIQANLGCSPRVFAYPHGKWDAAAEQVLKEYGYRVTLITHAGHNTVVRGKPDSLYLLKRYNMNEHSDLAAILAASP